MIQEKLYRDPVHGLISLNKSDKHDRALMALIDAPEMQRLRRIRQLGMASVAYQGAEHTRFSHALGVMWIATRILERLCRIRKIPPLLHLATRCAALLHDVGHGPMSHVFEKFQKVHHENWTCRVIASKETGINKVLRHHDARLPRLVCSIIEGRSKPAFLSQVIASQLDADRFDYLLRDSMMTGVKYGIYDFERILHLLRLDERGENIIVAANGVQPVEKYLQSRYHMYGQIYLHKTVRAAEAMVERMLHRAALLLCEGDTHAGSNALFAVLRDGERATLTDFLQVDDYVLLGAMREWKANEDPVLSDLATRLLERRLFKTIDVTQTQDMEQGLAAARKLIAASGLDPEYYLIVDTSGDIPYKPYDPQRPEIIEHILVEGHGGKVPMDVHEVSEVVAGLTKAAFQTVRVIFPEAAGRKGFRKQMQQIFRADVEIA